MDSDSSVFTVPREMGLREPNQFRIIGKAFVGFEIPILCIVEPLDVAIEENKLCAMVMQIGMDIVPFCDRTNASVVKKPNTVVRLPNTNQPDLICSIDVFIQTIVE